MDGNRFDVLTRHLVEPGTRRGVFRWLGGVVGGGAIGALGLADAEARRRKKKNKKKKKKQKQKPPEPCGGDTVCTGGRFCCDDEREICCNPGDTCCNVGPGTGSCCSPPNRCARPVGQDGVPFECCPPERQTFAFGVVRCCPVGERSLGTEISTDDGPCCPEEKYCSEEPTGGTCCADLAPVCLNASTGQCCNQDATCGSQCCTGIFGDCCNDQCHLSELGPWTDCGGYCCQAGKSCCGTAESHVCCDTVGEVCVLDCLDGAPACCPTANPGCCDIPDCSPDCGG